jgi:hypothetical protein
MKIKQLKTLEDFITKFEEIRDSDDITSLEELKIRYQRAYPNLEGNESEKEQFHEDIQERLLELKSNKTASATVINDPNVILYDYSKYSQNFPSWQTLNKDNLPYPVFLRDFIIPKFHPLPQPHLQNAIVAVVCLINSSVLPPLGDNCGKEVSLPSIYINGGSGSGKTQLAHTISRHYPQNAKTIIKGATSGGGLLENFNSACHVADKPNGEPIYRPSIAVLENFYLTDIERWGVFAVCLLANERRDAVSYRGGSNKQTFHSWLLKVFTSIDDIQSTTERNKELIRRSVRIYTETATPELSSGGYNWNSCKDEYTTIWAKQPTEDIFYRILAQVHELTEDSTDIPMTNLEASRLIIAVGVYTHIWDTIDEAVDHMYHYWNWINNRDEQSNDALINIATNFLDERYSTEKRIRLRQGMSDEDFDRSFKLTHSEVMQHVNIKSDGLYLKNEGVFNRVVQLYKVRGFSLIDSPNGLVFVKSGSLK